MEDWPIDWWDHPVVLRRRAVLMAEPLTTAPSSSRSVRPRGSPEPVVLADIPRPGSWARFAACRGMFPADGVSEHPFFPHRGQDQTSAMSVCVGCTVRLPCADYALSIGPTLQGIFGSLNERQRRQRRRRPAS